MDYAAKNQQFLSWFWDLASDDTSRRITASEGILSHIENAVANQKGMNDEGSMVIDLDYALKRLIRGLSSSRDSARHGFATCLSAMLSSGAVKLEIALPIIDNSTHIRGKLKGSEERDLIFGKLFAYLAVARSGILAQDAPSALIIFKRLLELHSIKGWLREVTSEALLVLLSLMDVNAAETQTALSALEEASPFDGVLEDWLPWQLQLAIGLQHFSSNLKDNADEESKALRTIALRMLPHKRMVTVEMLSGPLVPILSIAAAGFPKIHRVWEMILVCIFGFHESGQGAPLTRAEKIGSKQEALLVALLGFLRSHLFVASREKRSLAFRLTVRLASLAPLALLPMVVNKTALRSIVGARGNKKHVLNTLAAHTIRDIVSTVIPLQETSSSLNVLEPVEGFANKAELAEARLVLASTFVEHGSANFDAITGIPAVATLLIGLDHTDVLEHLNSLLKLVASSCADDEAEKVDEPEIENDGENEHWQATDRSAAATALAALEAITSLAKNRKLLCRGSVCSVVTSVLVKLACFEDNSLPDAVFVSDSKKKSRSKKSTGELAHAAREGFSASVDDVEPLLQAIKIVSPGGEYNYPAAVITSASSKLLTLLAEVGSLSSQQLDSANGEGEENKAEADSGSMLSQALATAAFLAGCEIPARSSEKNNSMLDDSVDPLSAFEQACAAMQSLSSTTPMSSIAVSLCNLLGQSCFQLLAANSDLAQTVVEIANCAPALVAAVGSTDDSEVEEPLGQLLDACFDLLAQDEGAVRSEQLSIKGVSSAVKRVWSTAGKDLPVGLGLLENVVSAVVGDDGDDGDDSEQEHDHDHDHSNDDMDKESDIDDDDEDASEDDEDASEDDEPQKDVVLEEDAALDLLASEQSDDEEELKQLKGMLPVTEHGKEADIALVHMLEQRKKTRKAGLLEAKKKQLLVRSRAIDILDAVLARVELPELLVPLLPPLLMCARNVQTGLTSSLAEGRAFESRLRGVIDQRICKKKFALSHFGDKETEEGILEMVNGLCTQLNVDIDSPSPSLRQLAQRTLLSLTRGVGLGDCDAAKDALGNTHKQLIHKYFYHKKSRIGAAMFDEAAQRFPDIAVSSYAAECAAGCETASSPFLRAEASRLLLAMVRRFGALNETSKDALKAAAPIAFASLAAAFSSFGSSESTAGSAKRLKPFMQCIRELCILPICAGQQDKLQQIAAPVAAKKGKGKKTTKAVQDTSSAVNVVVALDALEGALKAAGEAIPTMMPLVQQTLKAVAGVRDGAIETVTPASASKTTRKRKGDSLEDMEEKLLSESHAALAEAEQQEKNVSEKTGSSWHGGTPEGKKKAKKSKK